MAGKPLDSVVATLDRARQHIPASELPRLVMNDPGGAAYVAAYARVLADGMVALLEEGETGVPLLGSFEVTENLLFSHSCASESAVHRWFSVLTACIELSGAADYRGISLSATLANLLSDTFALHAANVAGAPVDLLPLVCRELRETCPSPHDRVLAVLGELLTASLNHAQAEAACRELHSRHEEFQSWYAADGERNFYWAKRPEFIWGAVAELPELPTWLELVERRFPSSPELARETRQQLLQAGEHWLQSPRE